MSLKACDCSHEEMSKIVHTKYFIQVKIFTTEF